MLIENPKNDPSERTTVHYCCSVFNSVSIGRLQIESITQILHCGMDGSGLWEDVILTGSSVPSTEGWTPGTLTCLQMLPLLTCFLGPLLQHAHVGKSWKAWSEGALRHWGPRTTQVIHQSLPFPMRILWGCSKKIVRDYFFVSYCGLSPDQW